MAFLRTLSPTATASVVSLAAIAVASSSFSHSSPRPTPPHFRCPGSKSRHTIYSAFAYPGSTLHMGQKPQAQIDEVLPEMLTEFMVDMKCEGCVSAVKDKLQTLDGIKTVDVDLNNQVVRVLGSLTVKRMTDALQETGRNARLIGQGVPEDFLISAAVAEFKGPDIFGVVRLAQVNMELARIEAAFSGLSPGKHAWSINEFGDLTGGAASTGKVYKLTNESLTEEPMGELGTLEANEFGESFYAGVKHKLRVGNLIGRSVVIYGSEDKSVPGITAAVIARSAGVGENYKSLCTCDGTTIWESSNANFSIGKV